MENMKQNLEIHYNVMGKRFFPFVNEKNFLFLRDGILFHFLKIEYKLVFLTMVKGHCPSYFANVKDFVQFSQEEFRSYSSRI